MKTKECPNCRELLVAASTVCGRCGTSFASTVPPPVVPVPPWLADLSDAPPGDPTFDGAPASGPPTTGPLPGDGGGGGPAGAAGAPGTWSVDDGPFAPPGAAPPPPGSAGPPPYGPSGYGAPGPGAPGYGAPGYGAPGYGAPGHAGPGYPGAPGYPGPGPAGYPAAGYSMRQTHPQATTALVLGIVSLVACGVFTAIPAIVIGNRVRREIRASGGALDGEGSARAGVVCGWVSVGFTIVGVLAFVALLALGTTVDTEPTFEPVPDSQFDDFNQQFDSEFDQDFGRRPRQDEFVPPTTR